MALDFDSYLSSVNLVELKKAIKSDSAATLEFALNYYRGQVNEKAILTEYDTRAEMVDRRETPEATALRQGWGNTYQIFSDAYVAKYNMPHWWALKLDMFSILEFLNGRATQSDTSTPATTVELPENILSGTTSSVVVDTQNGKKVVAFENELGKDYEVFTMLDETMSMNDRVDKIDSTSFRLSLYSFETFEKTELDCSISPIEVAYIVVFK
jgi:hypothetical protein